MSMADPGNAVVLVSGGLDSATTLALAQAAHYRCFALAVDYGQRHRSELEAARRVTQQACSTEINPLDLRAIGGSALTADIGVPISACPKDSPKRTLGSRSPTCRRATPSCFPWRCHEVSEPPISSLESRSDYSGYPDCRPSSLPRSRIWRLATRAGVEGVEIRSIHPSST
jgi:7-cyano-7-deazaguanine synthase